MKRSEEILTTMQAFMGAMRDGDMRGVVANLQAAMEYQAEELRIYRRKYEEATGKKRPELSDDEKRRLAGKARTLNKQLLNMVDGSWSPRTVMGWYQTLISEKYDSTGPGQKRRGRPSVSPELEKAIVEIARSNTNWGYKCIQHYLNYLGFTVSFMTVKRVMNRHGFFASPDGRQNSDLNLFYDAHRNILAACDFCTYELITPHGLDRRHILFFEDVFTREAWLGGITREPDGNWMTQIARNQADMWDGKLKKYAYLIHDRDPLFTGRFSDILRSIGCKTKLTQPRRPEQNGFVESFIKTFKTECLDHLLLSSEAQLRYVVNEFLEYYNRERPHSGLGGRMIKPLPQDADGEIVEFTRLGGLLKSYRRVKRAA